MTLSLLDTTILSNFAHVQQPELVRLALGDQAATTPAVLAELHRGEALGLLPRVDWRRLLPLTLTDAEQTLVGQYQDIVDVGEAECLAVAVMRQACLLIDDLAARRLAQAQKVPVSGTLGLLLRLIQQKHLAAPAADALLTLMRQAGYRSPVISLHDYLG